MKKHGSNFGNFFSFVIPFPSLPKANMNSLQLRMGSNGGRQKQNYRADFKRACDEPNIR